MSGDDDYMYDCRNENTKGAERQLKFLVYCLEAACRAADEAGEQERDQIYGQHCMHPAPPCTAGIDKATIGCYPAFACTALAHAAVPNAALARAAASLT